MVLLVSVLSCGVASCQRASRVYSLARFKVRISSVYLESVSSCNVLWVAWFPSSRRDVFASCRRMAHVCPLIHKSGIMSSVYCLESVWASVMFCDCCDFVCILMIVSLHIPKRLCWFGDAIDFLLFSLTFSWQLKATHRIKCNSPHAPGPWKKGRGKETLNQSFKSQSMLPLSCVCRCFVSKCRVGIWYVNDCCVWVYTVTAWRYKEAVFALQ